MKQIDKTIIDKLQEIADLQIELKFQEGTYTSLLKEDEALETLKEVRLKIEYLKTSVDEKEKQAVTLFI